jgi:hypothetical protein
MALDLYVPRSPQIVSNTLLTDFSQTEKLYDIAVSATNILCNINPPYGTGMAPLGSFTDSLPTSSTPQTLAEDFLLLLSSFRGGNHPFLEKYKAHLHSLQIPSIKVTAWATQ